MKAPVQIGGLKMMKNQMNNPFNRERFLFFMLAGIFIWQGVIFSFAVIACFRLGGINACPELGRRWENTSGYGGHDGVAGYICRSRKKSQSR